MRTCEVEGCERKHLALGYCKPHYRRLQRWGDPLGAKPNDAERFMAKVKQRGDGCWEWTAAMGTTGYGKFSIGMDVHAAHRASHLLFIGPIPDGHEVDHLCFLKACVNPDHLEAVTPAENTRRAIEAGRCEHLNRRPSTCPAGHPYEGAGSDVYITPDGYRECRHCRREAKRRWRRREADRRNP